MDMLKNFKVYNENKSESISDERLDNAQKILDENILPDWDYNKMGYYIIDVSGRYQVYYTLWRFKPSISAYINPLKYITNLSTDFDLAIKKAKEMCGKCPIVIDRTGTLKGMQAAKKDIMTFGKYRGQHIGDVFAEDPKYIVWLADNYRNSKSTKQETQELLNYYKNLYYENITKENIEKDKSKFIGNVGDKIEKELKIYKITTDLNNYNHFKHQTEVLNTYKLIDNDENKYIAYNIDKVFGELKENDLVNVSAKIKNHKEVLGIKFTVLNFVKNAK